MHQRFFILNPSKRTPPSHTKMPLTLLPLVPPTLVLLNAGIRGACPSSYVPAARTSKSFYGSVVFARALATVAEYAFYQQEARSLGLDHLWLGEGTSKADAPPRTLFWLWCIGEVCSWLALLLQSQALNFLEDTIWCVWQLVAFTSSTQPVRWVLAPVIAYYVCLHLPQLIGSVDFETAPMQEVFVQRLDDVATAWVVPSVLAKVVLFVVFWGWEAKRRAK